MSIIHLVSVSTGKDSTATALLALEKHPKELVQFVFADTGNEHEAVYEYLDYMERELGIKIHRLKADFSRQIYAKRKFIARDKRTRREYKTVKIYDENGKFLRKKKVGGGHKVRWTNKAKRRALSVLYPTGNPFLDLCLWKGRFPSRRAQFCTQHLKTELLNRFLLELVDESHEVISWQGVRRDESEARKNILQIEEVADGIWHYRPIADWTAQETIDKILSVGLWPNSLYSQGMDRVGCMPCINCNKGQIREIAQRFDDHVQRIAVWEKLVALASKPGMATFFSDLDRDSYDAPDIWAKINWAKTLHGGRKMDLFADIPSAECTSSYGLCDAGGGS